MKFTKQSLCFFGAAILVLLTGFVMNPIKAEAKASTGTVYVTGVQHNGGVQAALKLMNKERSKRGLKALKLDQSLTGSAITRSAELAILLPASSPHKRPNGKNRSSVNKKINYEICATTTGYGASAKKVVSIWMNSPSHKKGILLKNAQSVGISCFEVDGTMYWTADISYSKAKSTMKAKTDKTYTKKVVALNTYLKKSCFKLKGMDTLKAGEEEKLTVYYRGVQESSQWIPLNAKSFQWSSGNPAVATVNSKGIVKAKKAGTVKISAKLKNGTKIVKTMNIKVALRK